MAALASLTENYTDSEDDEERLHESGKEYRESRATGGPSDGDARDDVGIASKGDFSEDESDEIVANRPFKRKDDNLTPMSLVGTASGDSRPASARSTPSKKMRLVSYTEENEEIDTSRPDEEDADSDQKEVVNMDLDSECGSPDNMDKDQPAAEGAENPEDEAVDRETSELDLSHERRAAVEVEAWSGGVRLPPEPPGLCDPRLQEQISKLWKRKQETGYDMNAVIQNKKAFRNPSIYEKLIQFCDIDEHGTNFPKELYDGHLFGKESFYDELAKVQAVEMEQREKAAKSRPKAETLTLLDSKSKDSEKDAKRRSKWDQAGPAVVHSQYPVGGVAVALGAPVAAVGSAPPTTTMTGFGSRPPAGPGMPAPTVVSASAKISAFGPLKKRH